ncbi:MAG: hypothetical protein LBV30_10160 [Propionibacteriaceae bacterium]|jgi:hypothetical protein|nr:hypothetical protein [Propionibacteriaceae bacterium]
MKVRKGILLVACGVAAGAIVGTMVIASMSTVADPAAQSSDVPLVEPTSLEQLAEQVGVTVDRLETKTNAHGETFGSDVISMVDGYETPDLVRVVMDNGEDGYVYSAELDNWQAANPEEAIRASSQQNRSSGTQPEVLIARNAEGEPIGTFTPQA